MLRLARRAVIRARAGQPALQGTPNTRLRVTIRRARVNSRSATSSETARTGERRQRSRSAAAPDRAAPRACSAVAPASASDRRPGWAFCRAARSRACVRRTSDDPVGEGRSAACVGLRDDHMAADDGGRLHPAVGHADRGITSTTGAPYSNAAAARSRHNSSAPYEARALPAHRYQHGAAEQRK
jgi:hypothetical protein